MSAREINLLPPERRRRLRNESMAVSLTDIIHSVNNGLLLMTLIGGAILASMWLFAVADTPTTEGELKQVVDNYQVLRDSVAEENAVLEHLASLGQERIVWSEVLRDFFAVTPPGITLHRLDGELSFMEGAVSAGGLTFSGQAVTRSTLTVYKNRLQEQPWVKRVDSPTSNLLERNNPSFQLSVALGNR